MVPDQWAIMQAGNLFVFAVNNPIMWADPTGLIIELAQNATQAQRDEFDRAIAFLKQSYTFREIWDILYNATEVFTIAFIDDHNMRYNWMTMTIYWDPRSGLVMWDNRSVQSAALGLAHEMAHAVQHLEGTMDSFINATTQSQRNAARAAIEADNLARFETPIARQLGEPIRTSYSRHRGVYRMNNSIHFRTTARQPFDIFIGRRVVNHNQWPIIGTYISAP